MTERLTEREREILVEIVDLHLATGEPVASGTVAGRSTTGLSPASIRSVMASLESKGLLRQPHTSAGRVPTDEGLRIYSRGLILRTAISPAEAGRLRALLGPTGSLEAVLARMSRVLSRLTAEVGVTLASVPARATVQSLHFVSVSPFRVLAVVVTQGGHVESRLLEVEQEYSLDELERISSFCSRAFAGLTLGEIRRRVAGMMVEERARYDRLTAGIVELGSRVSDPTDIRAGEVYIDGAEHLLDKVDASQLEEVRQLLTAILDKARLVTLLDGLLAPHGPRVLVGSDLPLEGSGGFGMILTSVELSAGEVGLVGVIGPKRMDYPRIIPLVDFLGNYLVGLQE